MNNKEQYRNLCKKEKSIPIFSQAWWLDAVCGEGNWDVVLIEKGGAIVATLPYRKNKKYGFRTLTMPKLTQNLGPWLKYPEHQKYSKRLAYEKELYSELIALLPAVDLFSQSFHYSVQNWLPFYWKGFSETTRYTYVLENLEDLTAIFMNFEHAKRKNIARAEKEVEVKFDLPAKDFYNNHQMTLEKQGAKIVYSFELFNRIYTAAYKNNAGKTIYAIDSAGNIHAALFVIWDSNSAYDLISTIDPDYRRSGAASLLIKNIISYVADKTEKFDFEGSMIEMVENSFRQFGAKQIPYFAVTKVSRKLKVCYLLRDLLKTIVKG